jgi:hypothetical protein
VLAVVLAAVGFAGSAVAGSMVPHRALYSMHLKSSSVMGALSGVRGAMTFELHDRCQGWEIESKVYLRLAYQGRDEVESVRTYRTWESKDGLDYRFRVHESQGEEGANEIVGVAVLDGKDQAGVAEYTEPSAFRVALPAGTVFPTRHAAMLISEAEAGKRHLGKVVFDGSTLENPYEISAVIGRQTLTTAGMAERLNLTKVREWTTRMAYFPLQSGEQTPDFELGVKFREDGIVSNLVQDFGDYALEATLDRIELLPAAPNC